MYYTAVQNASHSAVKATDAYSSFHLSLSHRNTTNVAPLWDGNLQGNRAVRAGISRMAALVYTVPRVDPFCSLVCVLHIFTYAECSESLARLHTTVPTT